ncbi:MAG: hypothetical protein IKO05_12160 [Selenomonadaceae bacterium]|nr:hypothetical protein [Selenomonadaceae bacterium]
MIDTSGKLPGSGGANVIDGVKVTFKDFVPEVGELENYVAYVRERVSGVDKITVKMCDDGCVDVKYTKHGEKFERIRRITG